MLFSNCTIIYIRCYHSAMSRLRRIETCDRVFFVTTNLAEGTLPLSASERDLVLAALAHARGTLHFQLLGYVLMPDHAHLVLRAVDHLLPRIMHKWKSNSGYSLQKARGTVGRVWQARYFDFICRRAADVSNKLAYVHENPVTAGLATRADQWRWSSAGYYSGNSRSALLPDRVEFSGDPDELLWPAPWRRL